MPRVISYTPAWLSHPNPGHKIFTGVQKEDPVSYNSALNSQSLRSQRSAKYGPRRTIARRGTEVFVAVGKEIRWADLVYLKEAWEDQQKSECLGVRRGQNISYSQYSANHSQLYRTIKTPVADNIRQLVISPHANYMAILTTHTVHIMILPEPLQLMTTDTSPMKLKTYTLGPTTHVTSQAAITSALWHPLGVNGSCMVTVTEDAMVRVWELSIGNHGSFDRPTLAIDLTKLADGTLVDQNFCPSVSGMNKAYSPDSVEMKVASACFARMGSGGWSTMTLWVAMREGDIYALCPLLPEKWSPSPGLISSLSVSAVAKAEAIEDEPDISLHEKVLAQQQLAWMTEIDAQEPVSMEALRGESPVNIYTRPTKTGGVPRLQGPFEIELAPEESGEDPDTSLSDIYVIGAKMMSGEVVFEDESDFEMDEADHDGLSVTVVCLLTSSGRLSICLDLDGIEAQWLPKSKSNAVILIEETELPSLLTFEVIDTVNDVETWEGSWPVFSQDVNSRYSFFITDNSSINFVDLTPWVFRLESELSQSSPGTDFRLDVLAKSKGSICERLYTQKPIDNLSALSASVVISDPDLGYFLLTTTPCGPVALKLEDSDTMLDFRRSMSQSLPAYDPETERPLILCEPRPVYEPPHALEAYSTLPAFLDKIEHSRYKRLLKEEIRLSPATLSIMTEAHKILSEETHRIGTAAAELFRRCERLQIDLKSHIKKAHDVAVRVDAVARADCDDWPTKTRQQMADERCERAIDRQKKLTHRMDRLRRKVTKGTSRVLSDKEKAWIEEVTLIEQKVQPPDTLNEDLRISHEPWARYEAVQLLMAEVIEQLPSMDAEKTAPPLLKVPVDIKKAKMAQIQTALDRETALIDATQGRLERLKLAF